MNGKFSYPKDGQFHIHFDLGGRLTLEDGRKFQVGLGNDAIFFHSMSDGEEKCWELHIEKIVDMFLADEKEEK